MWNNLKKHLTQALEGYSQAIERKEGLRQALEVLRSANDR